MNYLKKQSVTIECAVAIYFLKNNKKESMIILIVCERYANDKRYWIVAGVPVCVILSHIFNHNIFICYRCVRACPCVH